MTPEELEFANELEEKTHFNVDSFNVWYDDSKDEKLRKVEYYLTDEDFGDINVVLIDNGYEKEYTFGSDNRKLNKIEFFNELLNFIKIK